MIVDQFVFDESANCIVETILLAQTQVTYSKVFHKNSSAVVFSINESLNVFFSMIEDDTFVKKRKNSIAYHYGRLDQ